MKIPFTAQQLFIAALLSEKDKVEKLKKEFFKKLSLLQAQHKDLKLTLEPSGAARRYKGYKDKKKRPQFWGMIQAGTVITVGMKSGAVYGNAYLIEYPNYNSLLLKLIYDEKETFLSISEVAAIIVVSNEIRVIPGADGDHTILGFKLNTLEKPTKSLAFKSGIFGEKKLVYK